MAEIHIERKKTNALLWLIPLLLLAAVFIWWMNGRGAADVGMQNVPDSPVAASNDNANAIGAGAVGEFTQFVAATGERLDQDRQHAFTVEGIRRLTSAIESLNPGAGAVSEVTEMRQHADALESSPVESSRHADMVRAAFLAGARAFALLPGTSQADATTLRSAAENVKADSMLLAQTETIDSYFRAAVRALESNTRR
ncbi:MAG TPA: hypothetical protein VFZ73_13385 [Gemmatimonadaceae bacterium]